MFVPISDDNPLRHIEIHYVTLGLLAANVGIFLLFQSGLAVPAMEASAINFGFVPGEFLHVLPAAGPPEQATLISYMFLHGSWLHLIANMAFLWVFGDNVEDALGHVRYLFFYLACGVAAALAHMAVYPTSNEPLIGASGAVAGIVSAYLILHPKVRVWVLLLWRLPLRLPAFWVLGFWIVLQVFSVLTDTDGNTAWWAHIGGLMAGAVLVVVLRRPGVTLFDRDLV
ncbi:MAG: rhomboid family intramembrane serine protease [Rhodobiaceae bacterium]|nr:rhomboid family intramembrane serine protease [Rhodobiaceae bacterium]